MMWARVKGRTENALLALPFSKAFMFRPGYIHPLKGTKTRTPVYNVFIALLKPFYFILKHLKSVTDTVSIGHAMINCVTLGFEKQHLDPPDINELAQRTS